MTGTIQLPHRAVVRVSLPARFLGDTAAGASERRAAGPAWRVPIVVLALVMFAQCFQYMIDIPPLYLLSKSWPFLTLPLFVWALLRLDMPLKVLLIVTLVWIIGVTPMMGIIQLGNNFTAALATTAKVWPFTYAFSLVGLLVWLRVPRQELSGTILWMGAATYVIMLALWIVVPTSAYGGGDVVTKLFMYDPERGYHLYMPMFFGMLLIFFLNRSFWIQPRLWKLALLAICFVLQFVIYKERTAIAAGALVVVVACASSAGRWRTAALAVLALAAGAGAFYVVGRMQQAADLQALGGSLAVRQISVMTAWNYLTTDPWRWLLGVGATTRFGNVTLAQLFGNRMFFLTDIGWLGVVFEYGLIGACLMAVVHMAGFIVASHWSRPDDALSQALADYVLYLIVVSAIYSVVFTPGELTTVIALGYYFARERKSLETYRPVSVQSVRPMPRQIALASPRPSGKLSLRVPSGSASNG
jgi:hypothetical protein